MKRALRIAFVCDLLEEEWPSMDLVAEMLLEHAQRDERISTMRIRPAFARRLSRLPLGARRERFAFNADRLVNRIWDVPRAARSVRRQNDVFHVCDHSYAHAVHALPAERVGVYCHDLDAFRCLLEPQAEPRPLWFRAMAQRLLRGMEKARVVFFSTGAVRDAIRKYDLLDERKLVQAYYGVSPEFRVTPDAPVSLEHLPIHTLGGRPFLLHVGSCIPRKRIDVLLDVFAEARREHPDLRLVQIGGTWTDEQRARIERLHIGDALVQFRGIDRTELAEIYRRATLVLMPSELEGFGLPVIEALSCGASVLASDIPPLREVGNDAVSLLPVADIGAWSGHVVKLLRDPSQGPSAEVRLAQAARFSWTSHAKIIVDTYLGLS
ncbi:glycosyltransferase family 4 protein [Pendulispora brunnea]|uniref:Glycosyltransferase family 4 protein n=1 Tax=Pendulispora brunnea TaxID=2905690 RepID=A0ABZ2JYJ4_9BACT